jgi:cyclohexanone monooxygenase
MPYLAKWAKDLYVFQRTPSSIDVRNNKRTDYEWFKTLKPGWQRHRMENFSIVTSGLDAKEDLVSDGWTFIFRALNGGPTHALNDPMEVATRLQLADYKKMESIRARVDATVKDRNTADALKPWYNQWCKRPCFNDDYLDAFNKPNVHLVHTDGAGIERVTEKGIVVAGKETELDCIVYATGFEFNSLDFSRSKTSMGIYGRNGLLMTEKWKDGAITFHGWAGHDFPNFMVISPLQAGGNPNYTHNASEMAMHLVYIMDTVKKRGIRSLEPTQESEHAWVKAVVETQGARGDFLKDCTPGYYNDEGQVNEVTLRNQPYGAGPLAYINILKQWREEDKLEGMTIQYLQDVTA